MVPFDKRDKLSIKYTPYWEVFPMYVIKAGLNQDTISQIVTPPPRPPKEKEIKSKICPSIGYKVSFKFIFPVFFFIACGQSITYH